jgi:hypothetical protein
MALNNRMLNSGSRSHQGKCSVARNRSALLAHLRVRGKNPPEDIVLRCAKLADAIGQARRTLRDFDSRNPWIFYDGVARTAYFLIDEEQTKFRGGGK